MESKAEYATPNQPIIGTTRQSRVFSHGIERGTIIAVPATIAKTVNRIGPYLGRRRVDSALCQAQQTAAAIISRFPSQESVKESSLEPNITIAAAPVIERIIPIKMPELKCSFFIATPIRNAKTGVNAMSNAAVPALVRLSPSTKR